MGEGAQVHGLGHYTALNKDIADKRYRKRLLNNDNGYKINGEVIKNDDYSFDFNVNSIIGDTKYYGGIENYTNKLKNDLKMAHELIEEYDLKYSPQEIMADDELYLNYSNAQGYIERMPQEIEFLNGLKGKKIEKNNGQLYKVTIPKDDVLLRENLPFSEQSPKVQKALKEIQQERLKQAGFNSQEEVNKMLDNLNNEYENAVKTPLSPWETSPIPNIQSKISNLEQLQPFWENGYRRNYIYDKLGTPEKATDLLNKHGIKGISYNGGIDGEARVIFNPDDIDIVRKYYNQPEAIEYFKKLPNYGAVVNSFDSTPINKKQWKQYAKDNLVGKSVYIPNYTTVSFTRNNLGKDYSYNMPEYPTLFDQLKGSNYAFSTNYKNEKDRIYDHFVNTNDNRLFDYLIEVIKDNEGDYHHNYKMMKNISRGDKP